MVIHAMSSAVSFFFSGLGAHRDGKLGDDLESIEAVLGRKEAIVLVAFDVVGTWGFEDFKGDSS